MFEIAKERFKKLFGVAPIFPKNTIEYNDSLCEVSEELKDIKLNIEPLSKGILLFKKGRIYKQLIEFNKRKIKNKIILNEKSSFLFTCGRRVLKKSMEKKSGKGRFFVALNQKEEVLGIIHFDGKEYKNKINIGHYIAESSEKEVRF